MALLRQTLKLAPLCRSVPAALYHQKVTQIKWTIACEMDVVQVIDHYENPRNVGKLDAKKSNVGTGLVGAPACGDVMKLQIEVDDDGKIVDAKFKGPF